MEKTQVKTKVFQMYYCLFLFIQATYNYNICGDSYVFRIVFDPSQKGGAAPPLHWMLECAVLVVSCFAIITPVHNNKMCINVIA